MSGLWDEFTWHLRGAVPPSAGRWIRERSRDRFVDVPETPHVNRVEYWEAWINKHTGERRFERQYAYRESQAEKEARPPRPIVPGLRVSAERDPELEIVPRPEPQRPVPPENLTFKEGNPNPLRPDVPDCGIEVGGGGWSWLQGLAYGLALLVVVLAIVRGTR